MNQAGPAPALDRCPSCGQASAEVARCPSCGGSLLVDVLLDPVPEDRRMRFKAAKAAAAAGIAGVDFASARAALDRPGSPVAAGIPRDQARALLAALAAEGFSAAARAAFGKTQARPAPRRAPRAAAAAAIVAVLVGAAVAGLVLRRSGEIGSPPSPDAANAPAPAPAPTAAPAPPGSPRPLSTPELFRLAGPAMAVVSCPGRLGSGFFATPDRVLTNAHVTCGPDATLEVKLADGRALVGRVLHADDWLDFAVVEVPGAKVAAPLGLGDSTALEAGDPVVLVGSPLGLDATVHEGKVSHAARNLHGVAHVQVNADVNPGNSGGPLLDGRGRAVGVVTLRARDGTGVGFALPVEYAREALGAPEGEPAARARWAATVARVAGEDEAEASRFAARLERPFLLAAIPAGAALGVVVMQRWPGGPRNVALEVEVRDGAKVLCAGKGVVREWTALEAKLKELQDLGRAERVVRWMLRRGLARDVHAGGAEVEVSGCPAPAAAGAVVTLRGGEADEAAPFPSREIAEGRRAAAARAELAARIDAAGRADAEGAWRAAFREARGRVAALEERRRVYRDALDRQNDALLLAEARQELPGVERELERAREALA
ncbi:MAG TPA: trypsin-like peptidase domain-containing protein, partial [Anaeromyxobacteraceae bacterium]|nr:trypsin-like peptidase domain-containing protein [Anaeromyxobacteraceae bacterium]